MSPGESAEAEPRDAIAFAETLAPEARARTLVTVGEP